MQKAKDPNTQAELDFYAEQLDTNRNNPAMLRGLAANLKAAIEQLQRLANQDSCPEELKTSPRRIGVFPVTPEQWWQYYRPILRHDISVAEGVLATYEQAIGSP